MRTDLPESVRTETESVPESFGGKKSIPVNPRVAQALANLRAAAETKKVDPICNAYQTLRVAANGMAISDMLALADKALGTSAAELVVSAYSHRRCFMCEAGTVPCERCEGSGFLEEGRACQHCDGLAVTACGFCGGTAWPDRNTIPRELVPIVLQRQIMHARADIKRVAVAAAALDPGKVSELTNDRRKQLVSWMIRLNARLVDLINAEAVDEDQQAHFGSLTRKIKICLNVLRQRE